MNAHYHVYLCSAGCLPDSEDDVSTYASEEAARSAYAELQAEADEMTDATEHNLYSAHIEECAEPECAPDYYDEDEPALHLSASLQRIADCGASSADIARYQNGTDWRAVLMLDDGALAPGQRGRMSAILRIPANAATGVGPIGIPLPKYCR